MIEGDDLVKEHQIDILEAVLVLLAAADARLAVFEIIVRKIPYESAGEGGEVVEAGASVA